MNYALGVTGYPGSGKSIVTKIADSIGFKTVSMGDQIRRRTREDWGDRLQKAKDGKSDEIPSDVYGEYATEMREKHGRGIVATWCKNEIINSNEPVFIDGIRSPESLHRFENYVDIELMFIHAPASLRFEWVKNRARDNEENFTIEDFINRDHRENKWGLNELIVESDYTYHNCIGKKDFERKIKSELENLYYTH